VEERQPHLRGGAHEPFSRADIEDKFRHNCAHGGWKGQQIDKFLGFARSAFDAPALDLTAFRN
jgi:hypothetical protein